MTRTLIGAISLAVLLAACGGGADNSSLSGSPPQSAAPSGATGPTMAKVLGVGAQRVERQSISDDGAGARNISGAEAFPGPAIATRTGTAISPPEIARAKAEAVTQSSLGAATDLIWHNPTTGQTVSWAMNGATTTSSTVLLQLPNWKVTGTADLNGDGQQDLIWENSSTNQIVAWLMNGTQTLQSTVLLQNAGWKITHIADFNGDGKADLLFYNAGTGQTVMWLMNGTTVLSSQILFTSTAWQVSLVADLNGDGKADLIWRNSQTGQTAAWLMNGTAVSASATLLELASWRVTQVGDLDGDGKDDLIWTNASTGQTVVWLMNGLTASSSTLLFTHSNWRVSRTADLDGDGKQDLIWSNSATGEVAGWLMNGATIKSNAVLLGNASWQLANVVDLNGDGKQDLIWRNPSTNQTVAWVMNGLTAASQTTLLGIPGWDVVGARATKAPTSAGALPSTLAKSASLAVADPATNLVFADLSPQGYGVMIYQGKKVYGLPAGQVGATDTSPFVNSIAFTDPDGSVFQMMLDETGLPTRLYLGEYLIQRLAVNRAADTIDLRVIRPDGTSTDFLGVSLEIASTPDASSSTARMRALGLQATSAAGIRPLLVGGTYLRCRKPDQPVDDSPEALGNYVQRQGTCLAVESIDTVISPVWSWLLNKAADLGEAKLSRWVGLGNTAYSRGRARLKDLDAFLRNINGGGKVVVQTSYDEGVRVVKKAVVVAEPVPSQATTVLADLKALQTQPQAPVLAVVPKDSIVVPAPVQVATPPTAELDVTRIDPQTATVGQLATFVVKGAGLSKLNVLTLTIPGCPNAVNTKSDANSATFTCTPTAASTQPGQVTETSTGKVWLVFSMRIEDPAALRTCVDVTSGNVREKYCYVVNSYGSQIYDGRYQSFNATTGLPLVDQTYVAGVLDGPYKVYNDSAKLFRLDYEGSFKMGVADGLRIQYRPDSDSRVAAEDAGKILFDETYGLDSKGQSLRLQSRSYCLYKNVDAAKRGKVYLIKNIDPVSLKETTQLIFKTNCSLPE